MAIRQLVSCQSVGKAFGLNNLFDGITLSVHANERLGLVGPNGSGKSTFLNLLADLEPADSGQVVRTGGVNLVYLPQSDTFQPATTVGEVLHASLPGILRDQGLDAIRSLIQEAGFTRTDQPVEQLSGGWRKRLAITGALAHAPDLLLLDEPTNHLDLEGILWLESVLRNASFAFVLVSHDRYLLKNVANRIVELDKRYPNGYLSVAGDYATFLQRKAESLEQQTQLQQSLSNKLRRELEWLQRGPKARTTKARSRIDSALQLQEDVQSLMRRVCIRPDPELTARFPDEHPCRVTLHLRDGRTLRADERNFEGHVSRPMPWQRAREKFETLARGHASEAHLDEIVTAVESLEGVDVTALTRLLATVTPSKRVRRSASRGAVPSADP